MLCSEYRHNIIARTNGMRIFEELDLSICIHNVLAENLWHCTGTTSPSECLAKQYTEDIGFVGF